MNARPPAPESAVGRFRRSFVFALHGIGQTLRTQRNARVHLAATLAAVGAGFWCGISPGEWCAVVVVIAMVWAAEVANTALEALVDLASPERHPLAGRAKDAAAGAVLCAAIGAAIVGAIVFGPRVLGLLSYTIPQN
jgi:diacylglycerol kinase